jgi:valyl-tRNA synthetase
VGETARVRETVDEALAAYRFNDAANALYAFVWGRVCDWYVELAKPLFASEDADIVRETRATMAWVLDQCLILLHPIMPFITEELWGSTAKREKMLVHADWPTYQAADLVDESAPREMAWVISLIESIRSVRGEMNVPAALQVTLLRLDSDQAATAAWERNSQLIQRLARVETLTDAPPSPQGLRHHRRPRRHLRPAACGHHRRHGRKGPPEQDPRQARQGHGRPQGRLSNPRFVDSAPEDVIEETRELLAEKEAEAARLETALARLAEVA